VAEASVLALQRSLVDAALRSDPRPLADDPAGFAAGHGLPGPDQAAYVRFRERLLVYRDLVRNDLAEPVATICPVTRALLTGHGAWDDCLADFLASRSMGSAFYRDVAAAFLGWLMASGWGQARWPFLPQLVHAELLLVLVARFPDPDPPAVPVHPRPRLGDRLLLAPPTHLVTYDHQVHLATPEAPCPAPGPVHLLAYRDADGFAQWLELTPATAALLLAAQRASLGQAALDLGLEDLDQVLELVTDLRDRGALRGFTAPAPG